MQAHLETPTPCSNLGANFLLFKEQIILYFVKQLIYSNKRGLHTATQ
jgi:hypothetical protein